MFPSPLNWICHNATTRSHDVQAHVIDGAPETRTYGNFSISIDHRRRSCASFFSSFMKGLLKPLKRIRNLRIFRRTAKPAANANTSIGAYRQRSLHRTRIAEKVIAEFKGDIASGRVEGLAYASLKPAEKEHFDFITSRAPEIMLPSMLQSSAPLPGLQSPSRICEAWGNDRGAEFGLPYLMAMHALEQKIVRAFAKPELESLEESTQIARSEEPFQNLKLQFH